MRKRTYSQKGERKKGRMMLRLSTIRFGHPPAHQRNKLMNELVGPQTDRQTDSIPSEEKDQTNLSFK